MHGYVMGESFWIFFWILSCKWLILFVQTLVKSHVFSSFFLPYGHWIMDNIFIVMVMWSILFYAFARGLSKYLRCVILLKRTSCFLHDLSISIWHASYIFILVIFIFYFWFLLHSGCVWHLQSFYVRHVYDLELYKSKGNSCRWSTWSNQEYNRNPIFTRQLMNAMIVSSIKLLLEIRNICICAFPWLIRAIMFFYIGCFLEIFCFCWHLWIQLVGRCCHWQEQGGWIKASRPFSRYEFRCDYPSIYFAMHAVIIMSIDMFL